MQNRILDIDIESTPNMIAKIAFLALFVTCQSAAIKPWWIQLIFPEISFTGKYDPVNFKAEGSLSVEMAENSNNIYNPAYWIPYKLAYAQYWIDYIANATEADREQAVKDAGIALNTKYSAIDQLVQEGMQNKDAMLDQGAQLAQDAMQNKDALLDQGAQLAQDALQNKQAMLEQGVQFAQEVMQNKDALLDQGVQLAQEVMNNKDAMLNEGVQLAQEALLNKAQLLSQYGEYLQSQQSPDELTERANEIVQQVQAHAQNLNQEAQQIVAQVQLEAEKQIQAIAEQAQLAKEEIQAEINQIAGQAGQLAAQVEEAAKNKIEALTAGAAQMGGNLASGLESGLQFGPGIIEQVKETVENVAEEALAVKDAILSEAGVIVNEAGKLASQIEQAAGAKIASIIDSKAKLEKNLVNKFFSLGSRAMGIASDAQTIVRKPEPFRFRFSF